MNKTRVVKTGLACALLCSIGLGAGIWATVDNYRAHKQIPEIRETIKQDYENDNIDPRQYTVKMEELARKDLELARTKGILIVSCVLMGLTNGICLWGSIDNCKDL